MKIIDDLKRNLDIKDYKHIKSDFISTFINKKYVLAIGQFGSVTYPGISDLDMLLFVTNNSLKRVYEDFQLWLNQQPLREYLFFHPPVVVTPDLMSYISYTHTLYDIRFLEIKKEMKFDLECKHENFLNEVWTTYILIIALRMISSNRELSARKNLLVLKNMHQSEVNLKGRKNVLGVSNNLRKNALIVDNSEKVFQEIKRTLNAILNLIDEKYTNKTESGKNSVSFNISRNIQLIRSKKSKIDGGYIYMNATLFDKYVETIFWNKTSKKVKSYYNKLSQINEIYKKEDVSTSQVLPFSYPFYKNSILNAFKSNVRKYIL